MSGIDTPVAFTDWKKCCLCQEVTDERLTQPRDFTRRGESGYAMLARNIPKLQELNQLPFLLNIKRLDDGSGIENTLKSHHAKYHRNKCYSLFNNTKVERVETSIINSHKAGKY